MKLQDDRDAADAIDAVTVMLAAGPLDRGKLRREIVNHLSNWLLEGDSALRRKCCGLMEALRRAAGKAAPAAIVAMFRESGYSVPFLLGRALVPVVGRSVLMWSQPIVALSDPDVEPRFVRFNFPSGLSRDDYAALGSLFNFWSAPPRAARAVQRALELLLADERKLISTLAAAGLSLWRPDDPDLRRRLHVAMSDPGATIRYVAAYAAGASRGRDLEMQRRHKELHEADESQREAKIEAVRELTVR